MYIILDLVKSFVSVFILLIYTLITAYVLKFNIAHSLLGFDFLIFTVIIVCCMIFGGAI